MARTLFDDFDFAALDDPEYKEDAVREDLVAPLLKALGYRPTGRQRMQRSNSLLHPFVMIGSQKRAVHIVPDYTLYFNDQVVLVLDAKRPSQAVVKSSNVEQVFSYAIHPDIRARSYALCNGRELVLYDIDRSEPVFLVPMAEVRTRWTEVLKHFSPEALHNHHHRKFQPDLGVFLKNAGFDDSGEITFVGSRITSLAQTMGGVLTATASPEMLNGVGFAGSFDMPMGVLPTILSCLPSAAAAIVTKALATPCSFVWVGGVIEVTWTVQMGQEEHGLYSHDPMIPLLVAGIVDVSRAIPLGEAPDGMPAKILSLPTILQYV